VHDHLVQQADVLPTLLEIAGLPTVEGVDGRPLGEGKREPIVTEWYTRGAGSLPSRAAIYSGHYKFVRDGLGGERLFDLERSPYEAVDVLGDEPEAAARLRAGLQTALEQGPERGDAEQTPTDPGLLENLRALGYVR
jgi:arylsulfatase A-like enzyme